MRDAVDGSVAKLRAEPVAQERVERAEPQPARLPGGLHRVQLLQHPRQLRGGEVGVDRQPAAPRDLLVESRSRQPLEHRRRALVLPHDVRRQRLARVCVPRDHRLALMVETARDDLAGGFGQHLGDGVDGCAQDVLARLLDPARLRMLRRDPPRRATRAAAGCASTSTAFTPVVPTSRPSSSGSLIAAADQ